MMRIGIIGAENSHTAAIATLINVEKLIKGFSVDCVWGETLEFAKKAAAAGQIPNIVDRPADMLGKIDALIVDHRHPKFHLAAARPFVKAGIPTFIDKPFCYRVDKGREFLAMARELGTPVTTGSAVIEQRIFKRFKKKLAASGDWLAGTTWGPCDTRSPYGGIFFYGIHQVSMILDAFGYDLRAVQYSGTPAFGTMQCIYPGGRIVTMNCIKTGSCGFAAAVQCTDGMVNDRIVFDAKMYLPGVKVVTRMFKTGVEPMPHDHILRTVEVLAAMARSIRSKVVEKV